MRFIQFDEFATKSNFCRLCIYSFFLFLSRKTCKFENSNLVQILYKIPNILKIKLIIKLKQKSIFQSIINVLIIFKFKELILKKR